MGKKDKTTPAKAAAKPSKAVPATSPAPVANGTKVKSSKSKKAAPPPPPSSSSSEESSSDAEAAAPPPPSKKKAVKADSSSDSDSSSEDEKPSKSAPTPKKQAPTASSDSSDSDSDSDSAPATKAAPAVAAKSTSDSEDSDSDSESDAEPAPAAKAAAKADSSDSEDDSDDSDSDADGDVKMKDASAPAATKRKADSDAAAPSKKAKLDEETTGEAASSTLWVGNLSWNVDDDWLKTEFEGYGEVVSARVQMDRSTGRSRGFGYVEFKDVASAQKAVADTSKEIDGRAPRMDIAPPRGPPDQTKRAKAFNDKVSDPSSILFVGNLAFDSTEDGVWEAFGDFGEVTNVRLPTDRETGQKKGFGYVEFGDQSAATKAFEALQGKELFGRAIRLDYSHPRDDSGGSGRGGRGGDRGFRGRGDGGRGGRGRGSFDRGGGRGGFGDRGGRGGGRGRGAPRGRGQGAVSSFEGKKTTF